MNSHDIWEGYNPEIGELSDKIYELKKQVNALINSSYDDQILSKIALHMQLGLLKIRFTNYGDLVFENTKTGEKMQCFVHGLDVDTITKSD